MNFCGSETHRTWKEDLPLSEIATLRGTGRWPSGFPEKQPREAAQKWVNQLHQQVRAAKQVVGDNKPQAFTLRSPAAEKVPFCLDEVTPSSP